MNRRFLRILACVLIAAAFSRALPGFGQEPMTKETIIRAWQDRQDKVKSARFKWTEQQTDTRGSISYIWKLENPSLKAIVPPKDTTFKRECSACFEANQLRYSYTTRQWSQKTEDYENGSYLTTFDGTQGMTLRGPRLESHWHQGSIRAENRPFEATNIHLQPFLMTFRPLTPKMRAYNLDDFDLTGGKPTIDKSPCWELSRRNRTDEDRLYVDPSRGFIILRYLHLSKGVITLQANVRFDFDAKAGWLPNSWTILANYPDGKLRQSYQARLESHEMNPTIAPSEFRIEFPLGTAVLDIKKKEQYIVKPDGSGKRPIPRQDIHATYEEILSSEPGRATKKDGSAYGSINWTWLTIIGIALAVGFVVFLFRAGHLKLGRTK